MISSIARIGKDVFPKNLFKIDSDYYLYILEYANFDFPEGHDYSIGLQGSGMSRILNNYQYNFNNNDIEKLDSYTFHSSMIMSWRYIFDIENLDSNETTKSKITPAFLFTTLEPEGLYAINNNDISVNEFIFLRLNIQDRDANRVPQMLNKMFSNVGETISKCTRADVYSKYSNVYVFDYCIDSKSNNVTYVKNEFNAGRDLKIEGSVIGGSGNSSNYTKNETPSKESFWKRIWQNVIAKIIIAVLTAICTGLLIYFGISLN